MDTAQQKEQERLKFNREHFEVGCSCIHTAKTLQPCPTDMTDGEAVAFYEQNCKCSRNYVQSCDKTGSSKKLVLDEAHRAPAISAENLQAAIDMTIKN